jgi:hypothetical protein
MRTSELRVFLRVIRKDRQLSGGILAIVLLEWRRRRRLLGLTRRLGRGTGRRSPWASFGFGLHPLCFNRGFWSRFGWLQERDQP